MKILRFIPWSILALITLSSLFLSISASRQESAVMDELAHIPAGYGYVRYLDYRLNPEHPPLLKALSALPLLFGNFKFPIQSSAWQKDVNGQWEVGNLFLYESGNDADKIIQWARLGPLLVTLLLIIFIYVWSKELMGRWWALIPAFLFSFSPTVLAHGHFVTTDVAVTFGIFIALYYLVKYLLLPFRRDIVYAGLAFGVAQLAKFSTVLLIPLFVFIVVVYYFWKTGNEIRGLSFVAGINRLLKSLWRAISSLALIFAIGYLLVYAVYFIFTVNYPIEKQTADTRFILTSFAGGPDPNLQTCKLNSGLPIGRRMRCLAEINIGMAKSPVLRPLAEYMLGVLMVIQRSSGGNTAYFLGEVSTSGWWYYFPVVFVLKEPIPSLALITIALLISLWAIGKKLRRGSAFQNFSDYLGTNFAEFSMLSFVVLYWAYSIKSPLNIGVRHILPTVPFIYILSAGALKKWASERFNIGEGFWRTLIDLTATFLKASFKWILITVLLVWYLAESLFNYPHFLSYFNQFGGSTDFGYRYVTDSNYDWGQDLKRLAEWVNKNHVSKIAVDYFGGGNPKYYMDNKVEYWLSSKGSPKEENIDWLAVSVNTLQGAKGKLNPGQERKPEDEYQWLTKPYEPFARAGKSIFIYKL